MGALYYETEQFEKAVGCFDKGIEIKPNSSVLWMNKGNSLLNLGKKKEAMEAFKEGLKIDPNSKEIQFEIERLENDIK